MIADDRATADGLRTFWFEFDIDPDEDCPRGTRIGAGVTAVDTPDAIELLKTQVFAEGPLPPIRLAIKNVDPRSLDPWHVLAHMLPPEPRGVWFPPIGDTAASTNLSRRLRDLIRRSLAPRREIDTG